MIDNLSVTHYRGLKIANVEDCRRINVFFGRNNCGKTTLLEAFFLLAGQSNPVLPFNVNAFRGYKTLHSESDVRINFYNLDTSTPIVISSSGTTDRKLTITLLKSLSDTMDIQSIVDVNSRAVEKYFGLKLVFDGGKSSELIVNDGESGHAKLNMADQYDETIVAELLHPRMVVSENAARKLTKLIADKQKDRVLSVMQLIDKKVEDVIVANDTIMVDVGADHFLPIHVMGDGMVKILLNLLTIYECAGGIALIDEVDNGLHYSMMEQMWNVMIKAAVENDVQLFVSTHSIDSIKGLNAVLEYGEYDRGCVSAYKLVKSMDDVQTALRYDADTLNYMINQEIEIR